MEIGIGVLRAFDISGSLVARRELSLVDPQHTYRDIGERVMHILLTKTGIYPIPKTYRSNWTNHLEEITEKQRDR